MLAELLAADLIPAVWVGDERTRCCGAGSRSVCSADAFVVASIAPLS